MPSQSTEASAQRPQNGAPVSEAQEFRETNVVPETNGSREQVATRAREVWSRLTPRCVFWAPRLAATAVGSPWGSLTADAPPRLPQRAVKPKPGLANPLPTVLQLDRTTPSRPEPL